MNIEDQSLWMYKFRPINLDNFVGDEVLKKKFDEFIKSNNPPHLFLFSEIGGTGKSSLVDILRNNMDCEAITLKGSTANLTDKIREQFGTLARLVTPHKIKLGIVDDSDTLSKEAQTVLSGLIDDYGKRMSFILTCNETSALSHAFMSRFERNEVIPPSEDQVFEYIKSILHKEKIEKYDPKVLAEYVKIYFPSIRDIMNQVQLNIVDGELMPEVKKYYRKPDDFWN